MQVPDFNRIATRTLSFTNPDGSPGVAYVDFSAPDICISDDGIPGWCCQIRTRGFDNDLSNIAYGADGVQALHLAMTMAGTMLAGIPAAQSSDWNLLPGFGFPEIPATPPGFTIPPEFQQIATITTGAGSGDDDNGGTGPRLSPIGQY